MDDHDMRPVHRLITFLQDRPELLPVHGLGDMAAGMADKPCDLLDRHAIGGTGRETNVCRRSRGAQSLPSPARSQTSWNIFRMCLAPSGVAVAVVNTLPVSCQCDPAASRSAAWSACHSRSAATAICAS